MSQVSLDEKTYDAAFKNYVLAIGWDKDKQAEFYKLTLLTPAQMERVYWNKRIKVSKKAAIRVEILSRPHGYTLLKAYIARSQ